MLEQSCRRIEAGRSKGRPLDDETIPLTEVFEAGGRILKGETRGGCW